MQRHQLLALLLTLSFGFILPESALGHRKDAGFGDRRAIVCSAFNSARVEYCKKVEYPALCASENKACDDRCRNVSAPQTTACRDKVSKYCDYYDALTSQLRLAHTSVDLAEREAQRGVDKCEADDKAAAKAEADRGTPAMTPVSRDTTLIIECKKDAYLAIKSGSDPIICAESSPGKYRGKGDYELGHFHKMLACPAALTAMFPLKSPRVVKNGELSECPSDAADAEEEAKYLRDLANKKSAMMTCEGRFIWLAEKKDGEPESCLKIEWKRYQELLEKAKGGLSARALRKEFKNAGACPWPLMDKMYLSERGKEAKIFPGRDNECSAPPDKPGKLDCRPPNIWDDRSGCSLPTVWLEHRGVDLVVWLYEAAVPSAPAAELPYTLPPAHVSKGRAPEHHMTGHRRGESDITGIPEDRAKRKEIGPVTPTPPEHKISPPKGFSYAKPPTVHTPAPPTPTVHVPKVPTPAPTPPTVRPPSGLTPVVIAPEPPVRAPTITGPGDRVGGVKADVRSKGKEEDLAAERDEVLKLLKKPGQ